MTRKKKTKQIQNNQIEQETRLHIAQFLPQAIARTLDSYHQFSSEDIPDDAKGFSAHHSACKVAIAHIELLIKLAKWADLTESDSVSETHKEQLSKMMADAEKELKQYQKRQDLWEQEGEDEI